MRFRINEMLSNIQMITSKEDYKRIDNMITYIRSYEFGSDKETEKISLDILYMLEDGIKKGQNVDEIIGTNDRDFVDEIFKNVKYKPNYFYITLLTMGLWSLIPIISNYFYPDVILTGLTVFTIIKYLLIGLISQFLVYGINKTIYNKKLTIVYTGIYVIFILVLIFFSKLLKPYDIEIPFVYGLIFSVTCLMSGIILKFKSKNK